ncbi:lycopene beta-cyclase CrtY [Acuticoccus yangtzensis]|uniref:lycopene beta-cyclase CrtY n=1 Tax=Acuticoccus yangtzensis TaxID=1443441 RepID=UPI0009494F6E|nr:lycopene beta-cyclase CrtY [Acuticoccus yangtzensis]
MRHRLIIAGGGLAGTLTALAFAARADVDVTLLEAGPHLGGRHTWSFYATDLDAAGTDLTDPLVAHRWSGYDVAFQGLTRTLSTPYRSITSASLDRAARARLGDRVRLGTRVQSLDAAGATLEDGTRLGADAVVDARGPTALPGLALRYQTFLGQTVRLTAPHGLTRPTIMDATVAQHGAYRFVYLLPFSADTLLIEDTYYTESPAVPREVLRERIALYAAARGWSIAETAEEEQGSLPLVLAGDHAALWAAAAPPDGPVPAGLRAGLFHPVTSYSLPFAVRAALRLAHRPGPVTSAALRAEMGAIVAEHFAATRFERLLNRMLFLAGRPEDRHTILARFHRLPQPLIERFYAGRLTALDRMHLLAGKPPVPIAGALKVLSESAAR